MNFRLSSEQAGRRLDAALAHFFPHLGLRGRRRLWKECTVLVDGIARSPAFRVCGHEIIRLVRAETFAATPEEFAREGNEARLLCRQTDLAFLYKPAGLHTEALAGSSAPSLAALLVELSPDTPLLLTRLDRETSGIVVAARDQDALARRRAQENAGLVEKWYLAVLEGELREERTVRALLDLRGKTHTRVKDTEGETLRHTFFRPLGCMRAAELSPLGAQYGAGARCTLALCRILKGARHQIRAHAAYIDRPLAGDRRYGAKAEALFYLHHAGLCFPDAEASCLPHWFQSLAPGLRDEIFSAFPVRLSCRNLL